MINFNKIKEKFDAYVQYRKYLENKDSELKQTEDILETKKSELEEIEQQISEKKSQLESLKTSIIELKDLFDLNFKEEFRQFDYVVDITNYYIIGFNGEKFIAYRRYSSKPFNYGGIDCYTYYIVLKSHEGNMLTQYKYSIAYDYISGYIENFGKKHNYEEHISKVYPELTKFYDNLVPNKYMKKICYKINNLESKKN